MSRPLDPDQAAILLALAAAHLEAGDTDAARLEYEAVLKLDPDEVKAHLGLAELRMPGDQYYSWLSRLQEAVKPGVYIEIGVARGQSLAAARPPTIAIGVDPSPSAIVPLATETHIFAEPSDVFFGRHRLEALTDGQPIKLAFVDGLHEFEQALRDFRHLELYSAQDSAILLHDTVPLDEVTQSRERRTRFWTGDVWKVVACLKEHRPDLEIFTIATPPSGLTVVLGLDANSRVLFDRYEEIVSQFANLPFATIEANSYEALNVIANDWLPVEARLIKHGVLQAGAGQSHTG